MILASHGIIGSSIVQATGLLAEYPGAAAAYSLRQLTTAYTGSAIEVRRTNNDVADIGFTSTGELDTTALLAFTGTGALDNGFVTKWYDQSGNGYNATQTTALNQPQIVSSGSVISVNGKPATQFDGIDDSFSVILSSVLNQPNSIIITHKFDNALQENLDLIDSFPNTNRTLLDARSGNYRIFAGINSDTSLPINTSQTLAFAIFDGSSSSLSINNNVESSLIVGSNGLDSFKIGNTQSDFLSGNVQELLIYNSNQSSNRTGISDNINDFYSIYP